MNRQPQHHPAVRVRMSREPVVATKPRDSPRVRRLTSGERVAEAGQLDHVACVCSRAELETWGCCCEAGGKAVTS